VASKPGCIDDQVRSDVEQDQVTAEETVLDHAPAGAACAPAASAARSRAGTVRVGVVDLERHLLRYLLGAQRRFRPGCAFSDPPSRCGGSTATTAGVKMSPARHAAGAANRRRELLLARAQNVAGRLV